MILNPDGTPYTVSDSIHQYNPDDPQHELFNLWDQEAIERGGSPVFYYEMFLGEIDPIYPEARGKIYSPIPVQLWAAYDPAASQYSQNQFGIDSPDEIRLEFNYRHVLSKIGHPPKYGSRIYTPHRRENWEIIQCNPGEFKYWGALRLTVLAKRFQESTTTGEGKVTQRNPGRSFEIR